MNAIIDIRQSKLPDTNDLPNCGSFFKNPIVAKSQVDQLLQSYPNLVHYPVKDAQGNLTDYCKVAAGWLIDQSGLKGKGIAPILTHVEQALVLITMRHKLRRNVMLPKVCNLYRIQCWINLG